MSRETSISRYRRVSFSREVGALARFLLSIIIGPRARGTRLALDLPPCLTCRRAPSPAERGFNDAVNPRRYSRRSRVSPVGKRYVVGERIPPRLYDFAGFSFDGERDRARNPGKYTSDVPSTKCKHTCARPSGVNITAGHIAIRIVTPYRLTGG